MITLSFRLPLSYSHFALVQTKKTLYAKMKKEIAKSMLIFTTLQIPTNNISED